MLTGISTAHVWRLDHVDPGAHPREAASVVTCIDGYEMARQGARRPALMIAALGSFVGAQRLDPRPQFHPRRPLAKVNDRDRALGRGGADLLALCRPSRWCPPARASRTATMLVLGLSARHHRARQPHRGPPLHLQQRQLAGRPVVHGALAIGLFGVSEILIISRRPKPSKAIRPKLRELIPRWKGSARLRRRPGVGRASNHRLHLRDHSGL